jgi:citrate lyase subunit beta/citryl-CoA lyase
MSIIRESFIPGVAEIAQAQRMLAAAAAQPGGVFAFEGRMVDEPVLRHARKTLARAGHSPLQDHPAG